MSTGDTQAAKVHGSLREALAARAEELGKEAAEKTTKTGKDVSKKAATNMTWLQEHGGEEGKKLAAKFEEAAETGGAEHSVSNGLGGDVDAIDAAFKKLIEGKDPSPEAKTKLSEAYMGTVKAVQKPYIDAATSVENVLESLGNADFTKAGDELKAEFAKVEEALAGLPDAKNTLAQANKARVGAIEDLVHTHAKGIASLDKEALAAAEKTLAGTMGFEMTELKAAHEALDKAVEGVTDQAKIAEARFEHLGNNYEYAKTGQKWFGGVKADGLTEHARHTYGSFADKFKATEHAVTGHSMSGLKHAGNLAASAAGVAMVGDAIMRGGPEEDRRSPGTRIAEAILGGVVAVAPMARGVRI